MKCSSVLHIIQHLVGSISGDLQIPPEKSTKSDHALDYKGNNQKLSQVTK